MSLITAIALMLRFYKGAITWQDIWERMTIRCFNIMFGEITNVINIENGEEGTPVSLTGEDAFKLAQRFCPKRKKE